MIIKREGLHVANLTMEIIRWHVNCQDNSQHGNPNRYYQVFKYVEMFL